MATTTYDRRSGWDTFAAILLFTFAFVRIISAINYFGDGANVNDLTNSVFGDQLWIWGIWDLCLAVLGLFAAVSLLRRRRLRSGDRVHLGRGVLVQSFLIIGFAPWYAATTILLATLMIFGLATASRER